MSILERYDVVGSGLLVLDVFLVALVATVIVCSWRPRGTGLRVQFVLHLTAAALVFALVLIETTRRLLSARGFLGLHAVPAVLALPPVVGERTRGRNVGAQQNGGASPSPPDRSRHLTRVAVVVLSIVIAVQAILAGSLNYDANTYRLTRIGYWLQEGRLGPFPTNDLDEITSGRSREAVVNAR